MEDDGIGGNGVTKMTISHIMGGTRRNTNFERFDYTMGTIFLYILFHWLGLGNDIRFSTQKKIYQSWIYEWPNFAYLRIWCHNNITCNNSR